MKTKSPAKKTGRRRVLATTGKQKPTRGPTEVIRLLPIASFDFSSGLDETRALAVEESLDERERRG